MPPATRVTNARATQGRPAAAAQRQAVASTAQRRGTGNATVAQRCPQSLDLLAIAPNASREQTRGAAPCRSVAAHEIRTESLPPCMSSAEVLETMGQARLQHRHTMPLFTKFTPQTLCLGVDASESASLHAEAEDARTASDQHDVPLYNLLVTVQPTRRAATQFFKYLQRLPGVPEQLQRGKGKTAAATASAPPRRSRRVVRQCWAQLDKAGLRSAAFYQRVSLDATAAKLPARRRSHKGGQQAAQPTMTLSLAHLTWANQHAHEVESDESASHSNVASSSLPPLPLIHLSSLSEAHVRVQEATRLLSTCVSLIVCAAHGRRPRPRVATAAPKAEAARNGHDEAATAAAVRIRIWLDLAYLLEANTRVAADLHDTLHTAAVNCLALPPVQEVVDLRYSTCQEAGLDGSGQSEVFAAFSVAYCCDVITLRRPVSEAMQPPLQHTGSVTPSAAPVPSHSAPTQTKESGSSTQDESAHVDRAVRDSSSSSTCDTDSLGGSSLFFTRESDKADEAAAALPPSSSNADPSFLVSASGKEVVESTANKSNNSNNSYLFHVAAQPQRGSGDAKAAACEEAARSHKRPREHVAAAPQREDDGGDDVPLAVLYSQPQSWATPLSAPTDDAAEPDQRVGATHAPPTPHDTATMAAVQPPPPAPCACLLVEACALVPMVTTGTQAAIADSVDRLRRVLLRWCDLQSDGSGDAVAGDYRDRSADVAARRLVVLLTRSAQELIAVLLAWTLRPCAEHALLVPLFAVAAGEAAVRCDIPRLVDYVLHAFALQPSLCYGLCVSAEGVAAMRRRLPAEHIVRLDKDTAAAAGLADTVAGWSATAGASITDTLSLISALDMHRHGEDDDSNNNNNDGGTAMRCGASTMAEGVFAQYCKWSVLAQSLRRTPRRPEVVLRCATASTSGHGANRVWYTGLVRPATMHALTFAPATSRETRLLLRQAATLRLSRAQWAFVLWRLADFFTPTQFRTAVDVVRTSEADYFTGYVCCATGYMRYEVASWVRRFVRVELCADLRPLLLLPLRRQRQRQCDTTPAQERMGAAMTEDDEACDWNAVLPRLMCSCVPRAHEALLHSATGQKRCRHMAELLYYFLTRQVALHDVS